MNMDVKYIWYEYELLSSTKCIVNATTVAIWTINEAIIMALVIFMKNIEIKMIIMIIVSSAL